MKKHIVMTFLLCVLLAFSACSAQDDSQDDPEALQEEGPYYKITPEEAKQMMEQGDVTVVDVRRAEEYAEEHIPSAILVPNETIENDAQELLPDKDAVLLVYCRTGIRSKQAAEKLVELGYNHVYDFGGIVDWPYQTEKE